MTAAATGHSSASRTSSRRIRRGGASTSTATSARPPRCPRGSTRLPAPGGPAAVSAGLTGAAGPLGVPLDGDGQNDPHDIPKLLAKLDEGYAAVSGRRRAREEKFVTRVLPSWVASRLVALATRVPVYDCGCGLKAYRREVVAG